MLFRRKRASLPAKKGHTRVYCGRLAIFLAVCLVTASGSSVLCARSSEEGVPLADGSRPGDLSNVQVSFIVAGKMLGGDSATTTDKSKDTVKDTVKDIDFRVHARLAYEQRRLPEREAAGAVLPSASSEPSKRAVRYYDQAHLELQVGDLRETTELATERRLIVAEATDGTPQLYCPAAPLTRGELDLIDIPADSLSLPGLLPTSAVSLEDTWQHEDQAMAALFKLDRVDLNECTSHLVKIDRGLATVKISGKLRGKVDGVTTEIQLVGEYRFDIHWKRITWFEARITQQREPGYAAPGHATQSQLKVLITPLEKPRYVTAQVDPLVQTPPGEAQLLLNMHCQSAGIRLLHDRRWHLLHARHQAAVMRMVDGGDMIAQCQLIQLPAQATGKQVRLEQFQEDIRKTLGRKFVQFEEAAQQQRRDGYRVLRVVVRGTVSEVPILWVYYHVADPAGHAISAIFTLDENLQERFSESDRILIASLEFVDRA